MGKKFVSASQLATALGITVQRIAQLVEAGIIKKQGRNQYPFVECREAFYKFKKATAGGSESEYLIYLKLKNDLLEKQNKIRSGELISVEDFLTAGLKIVGNARAKLLPIPSKAAPLLVGSDDKTARQLLSRFVDEAIRELKIPDFRRIARDRQKIKYDRRKK